MLRAVSHSDEMQNSREIASSRVRGAFILTGALCVRGVFFIAEKACVSLSMVYPKPKMKMKPKTKLPLIYAKMLTPRSLLTY